MAPRRAARLTAAVAAAALTALAPIAGAEPALPDDVVRLLSADPLPSRALDPSGRYLLLVHQRGLQAERVLTEPTVEVAGVRLNPRTNSRYGTLPYFALTLADLRTGRTQRIPVPPSHAIGFPQWAPDGSQFAFTVTVDRGVELWAASAEDPSPRRLLPAALNAAHGVPCAWLPDSRALLCHSVARKQEPPKPTSAALRLLTQTVTGSTAAPSNDGLAEYFLRVQLMVVDAAGEAAPRPVGHPAVIESTEPSPNGEYVLVTRRLSPYSAPSTIDSGGRAYEVWDTAGRVVHALNPSASASPPRALQWQPTAPATVVWVERRGTTEHVLTQAAPFDRPPDPLFTSERRFAGLHWLQDSELALLSEYDSGDRVTRLWLLDAAQLPNPPRVLGTRGGDGPAPGLGWPALIGDRAGRAVVRVHRGHIFLSGRQMTPAGSRAYLDRLELASLDVERLWQSTSSGREEMLELLAPDGHAILTQIESVTEPPNYTVRNLRAGTARAITHYRHPVPELAAVERVPLRYRRADGVEMSSLLYVPPAAKTDGPRPMVLWAYPREYRAGTFAAAPKSERFADVERALQLFFLLRGYAVLDDVSMPVIGSDNDANDTFVPQIVANAQAAIDAAAATGAIDPERVAVAGHSYGAFMVANLLAHSRLFKVGMGLSGAYNRTLTPFGFQTERRTLWEAPDAYLAMSPLLYSHRIEAPLLLVHGLLDDNAGTLPIQSQYLYEAIRRNGGSAELLLLPSEGHSYRGRESVLSIASAMLRLVDTHLQNAPDTELQMAQGPSSLVSR